MIGTIGRRSSWLLRLLAAAEYPGKEIEQRNGYPKKYFYVHVIG